MRTVMAHGAHIPVLGFGTYGMSSVDLRRMIPAALHAGLRHIDTAQVYGNEADVGAGISSSGVPRSDVSITTKVWVANYSRRRFGSSVDESLRKLRSDYIDLLLLHWPHQDVSLEEQIDSLNAAVDAGKVRHIGVSNYNRELLRSATSLSRHPLVTNQFEYHPYLDQDALIQSCRAAGVAVMAYCGMAVGRVFTEPVLQEIAARYGRSVAQVVLRWLIQQPGVVALSRTVDPARIAQNAMVFDFELTPGEMGQVHRLARPHSRIVNPPGLAPEWD